jgi:hypothetical protein
MSKFIKPDLPKYKELCIEIFSNAIFISVLEDAFMGGWTDRLMNHPQREDVKIMLEKRDKKIARKLYNHEKESIRFLSALVLNDANFEIKQSKETSIQTLSWLSV